MYYILIILDPPVDSVLVAGPVGDAGAGRHLSPVDGHAAPDLKHVRTITDGIYECGTLKYHFRTTTDLAIITVETVYRVDICSI